MTDHPNPNLVLMTYTMEDDVAALVETSSQSLADRAARQSEYVMDFAVDPSGKSVAVSCYTGKLKVVQIQKGELSDPFDVS